VVREEGPGVDRERPLLGQAGEAGDEVGPVGVLPEDRAPFEAAHHHMVEGPGGVEARLPRHGMVTLAQGDGGCPPLRVPHYESAPGRRSNCW
jgi:hypothetical protein